MQFSDLFKVDIADVCKRCCSNVELSCFNLPRFLIFILFSVIAPYVSYQYVADAAKLGERKQKTTTEHISDCLKAAFLQVPLYLIGNQSTCFDWVTIVSLFSGMFLFGFISEQPALHHSLTSVHAWGPEMYSAMIGLTSVVLAATGFHVYLAKNIGGRFWIAYLSALFVPLTMLGLSWAAVKRQNKYLAEPNVALHLHHHSIFYALAFFTRFAHPISRIAAGLAMGCSMHGIAAYGFGDTFVPA